LGSPTSIIDLLIAVVLGGLLGYLVTVVLGTEPFSLKLRPLAGAVLFAVVIEVLVVTLKSRLVVLGAEINPKQFLPALTLAMFVTGGPTLFAKAKDVLERLRGGK
jgi:hypothetical protein